MTRLAWSVDRVPRLDGKTFIVTGANSGIGYEAARVFARGGARVVIACRSASKSADAIARLRADHPEAAVEFMPLDLASLASVRTFAAAFLEKFPRLDVLVNNAGVMALPLGRTEDGFEMQFGINHLGHFALTGLLFDRLASSAPSRIVTVSSSVHKAGKIDFENLDWQHGYSKWPAYARSKLANLLFTRELDRRLRARNLLDVRALACHPGYAATNLQSAGPRATKSVFMEKMMRLGNTLIAQSAEGGALPTVYAAVDPGALSGDYIGPSGLGGLGGSPVKVKSSARSHDEELARKLWAVSEQLTGVRFLD